MRKLSDKKIAVIGFGREGRSVLKFLKYQERQAKERSRNNYKIWILDKNTNVKSPKGANVRLGKKYLSNLKEFDIIYRSPGIPYNLIKNKIMSNSLRPQISSATELFFDFVCRSPGKNKITIIGITGTKGKSTTSTLIYKILKNAGRKAYLAGNIGKSALGLIPLLSKLDYKQPTEAVVVLELSSFQLQELKYSPQVAVILDIFPDHMDAHKNFREYLEAKTNIAKWQKKNDAVFYYSDNKYFKKAAEKSKGQKIAIADITSQNFATCDVRKLRRVIKIPGEHQLKNAAMAIIVSRYLGISEKTALRVIAGFRGLPHRLELVRTIKYQRQKHSNILKNVGISWYNDSASTNPHTTVAAIKSFKEPLILIAGGKDKNLDYKPLAQALKNSTVRAVVLYGGNKNKIMSSISSLELKITKCSNLKGAILAAHKIASRLILDVSSQILNGKCATVLLSPASASLDQFHNYKERGEKFKNIVKSIKP